MDSEAAETILQSEGFSILGVNRLAADTDVTSPTLAIDHSLLRGGFETIIFCSSFFYNLRSPADGGVMWLCFKALLGFDGF